MNASSFSHSSRPTLFLSALVALGSALLLFSTSASAQSSSDSSYDDWGATESRETAPYSEPTRTTQTTGSSNTRSFLDNTPIRGYNEFVGPYGQFGVSVGVIEFDGNNADVDAGGGFTITGGYRFFPWLSAEANFSYLGGGEVENTGKDADFFAFTFGPKVYPLGALDQQPIPEFIQPYGLIAIGGGEYDVEDSGFEESTFIARFLIGSDVWVTDQFGVFVEGGYHVAADDDIDGTGLFTFGGQMRF